MYLDKLTMFDKLLLLFLWSYLSNKVICDVQIMGNQQSSQKLEKSNSKIAEHVFPNLFTNETLDKPFLLNLTNYNQSSFNGSNPTVVLTHGLNDNGNTDWIQNVRTNYFKLRNYNIIVLDWAYYANKNYLKAIHYVPKVGHYMAKIILSLVESGQLKLKNVHIIGHSLGGHVVGFVGKAVLKLQGEKVGRITGLDPAGPLYGTPYLVNSEKRLDKDDADFVDIIHTDGGFLGLTQCIGDADFYPNGGYSQPGCEDSRDSASCNHLRSALYYSESILSDNFISSKCKSWKAYKNDSCKDTNTQSMGFPVNVTTAKGRYYLVTNSESPFAQGQN